MTETILLRFNGGPLDGDTRSVEGSWPPPANIVVEAVEGVVEDATYRKTNESQLPDDVAEHPGILRGAEYQWTPVTP